jgi:glutaredoxin
MHDPAPILYTQNGCAASKQARDWLVEHSVPFVERNVSGDAAIALELAATGIFATPLLVIGDVQIFGFKPDNYLLAFGEGDRVPKDPGH